MLDTVPERKETVGETLSNAEFHRLAFEIEEQFGHIPLNTRTKKVINCPRRLWEYHGTEAVLIPANEHLKRWPVLQAKRHNSKGYISLRVLGWKSEAFCEHVGLFGPSSIAGMKYSEINFSDDTLLHTINRWLTP